MTAKKPASQDQESIAAISRRTGVSRRALAAWRDDGVNVRDEGELQARIKTKRGSETEEDLGATKLRKLQAEADIKEIDRDKARGVLVSIEEAISDAIQTGTIEQQAWMKMPEELIPMLTGLESGAMMKVARSYVRDKLHENAEAYESINSFSIRTPPGNRSNATAGHATKRVGRKERPPAKQRIREKVSAKRSPGARKRS